MRVAKRNGTFENVSFDKIASRLQILADMDIEDQGRLKCDSDLLAKRTIESLVDGISTERLDLLAADRARNMLDHPHFPVLAARILVNNMQKKTPKTFSEAMNKIDFILNPDFLDIVNKHADFFNAMIVDARDYRFDVFGFKTLESGYLLTTSDSPKEIVERPQYLYARVAVALFGEDLESVKKMYDLTSQGYFTPATPTLFNMGTKLGQGSSCFLVDGSVDSIEDILETVRECGLISKSAGGIGIHISGIRSKGSRIAGVNGKSDGIVPMLQLFNAEANYINQGGRRPGSFAFYLEPWHADLEEFLELRTVGGDEHCKARELFYALWVPDLFMKQIQSSGDWWLMCPNECPGLADVYGDEFESLYMGYVNAGKFRKKISARDIWIRIMATQFETGMPYMTYKDAVNRKSNQKNIGVTKSSNLCAEITEVSTPDETAVCNLASVCLNRFVKAPTAKTNSGVGLGTVFDFEHLIQVAQFATKAVDRVIDINRYPTKRSRNSNTKHRPIGIGAQGLHDVFFAMGLGFESDEAAQLNKDIFESLYFGCVTSSADLAAQYGHYESFPGSPASLGELQFHMWEGPGLLNRYRCDWAPVIERIKQTGLRNSLLTCCMPTASTAHILGNFECIEPMMSNVFKRKTKSGEFLIMNKWLVKVLLELDMWSPDIVNSILSQGGSVAHIESIPWKIRNIFKTVWEISPKCLVDYSADRGPFVDQSQSLNIFLSAENSMRDLNVIHFRGWKKGLKTGMYYLRTEAPSMPMQFTVTPTVKKPVAAPINVVCTDDICVSCGS